ncbi:MAG: hypothetical protein ACFE9D_09640 [Promethearchaeota archaeon]
MKCATHLEQDAIGVCHSCGGGVCPQCQQRIGGVFYCLSCLDAGRYRPPQTARTPGTEAAQMPPGHLSPLTRNFFTLGILAMSLLIAGFYLLYLFPMGAGFFPAFPVNEPRTMALVVIALSITITGIAFFGYFQYFRSIYALSVSLLSLLSGWLLVLADLALYHPEVLSLTYNPGPLFPLYFISTIIGYLLLAVTFINWGILFIRTRKYVPTSTLSLLAGIAFILAAHVIILYQIPLFLSVSSTYYLFSIFLSSFNAVFQLVCIEPAAILSIIIFYRLRK